MHVETHVEGPQREPREEGVLSGFTEENTGPSGGGDLEGQGPELRLN